jgi:hypothetical protein
MKKIFIYCIIISVVLGGGYYGYNKYFNDNRLVNKQAEPDKANQDSSKNAVIEAETSNKEQIANVEDDNDNVNKKSDSNVPKTINPPKENKGTEETVVGENVADESEKNNDMPEKTETSIKHEDLQNVDEPSLKAAKEISEKIEDDDKKEGIKLATKINVPKLLGYLKGGLTQEEKEEIKKYLHENLSEEEYLKTKELVNKYFHLLEK